MSLNLRVALFLFSILLFVVVTYILKKGSISEKYSLLWYSMSVIILLVSIFPNIFVFISDYFGFQVMSNLIIGIIIALLTFITISLTIIVSGQKKKLTLLIQEISLLKEKVDNNEE